MAVSGFDAIHVAWGFGDPSWGDSPPAEDASATALENEVGRREVSQVAYAVPDGGGSIVVPNGTYAISPTPTKYLYIKAVFDYADASDQVIREVAIFVNTVRNGGVPIGQQYLIPSEIADPGIMYSLRHESPALVRSPLSREQFEFVLTF